MGGEGAVVARREDWRLLVDSEKRHFELNSSILISKKIQTRQQQYQHAIPENKYPQCKVELESLELEPTINSLLKPEWERRMCEKANRLTKRAELELPTCSDDHVEGSE